MSSADGTRDQLERSSGEAHGMITIEDLLSQLDRVAPSVPGYDQAGLDRLMAWMASDDPADHDAAGANSGGGPTTGKILIAGGQQAGSADFITRSASSLRRRSSWCQDSSRRPPRSSAA